MEHPVRCQMKRGIPVKTKTPMQNVSWFQPCFMQLRIRNFSNSAKKDANNDNEGEEVQRQFLVLQEALGTFQA